MTHGTEFCIASKLKLERLNLQHLKLTTESSSIIQNLPQIKPQSLVKRKPQKFHQTYTSDNLEASPHNSSNLPPGQSPPDAPLQWICKFFSSLASLNVVVFFSLEISLPAFHINNATSSEPRRALAHQKHKKDIKNSVLRAQAPFMTSMTTAAAIH